MRKPADKAVPADLEIARKQIEILEEAGKVLQECQASLPLPSPEEMSHIRKVRRTLTPETYRLGVYQRVMMAIENAADDLRAIVENTSQENLQDLHLSSFEVNAIRAAIEALSGSGPEAEEKP
jgi:hypothetical protein